MSESRTVWHAAEGRQDAAANRQPAGILLAVCLVLVVAAAEVIFLNAVAAPDSVNMMQAAEGIAAPP